mmetsp:Transcript_36605/g.90348  ORF Transcript_36605/g.90348 Transcript_36605/m.90348 type:complete len:216 (-) Transcript_36605:386-1033(-)
MAVRRRAGSARKMMAFSRIVNCHTEEEYEKIFKKAGDTALVLVEFVAGWSTSSKSMQPYMTTLAKSPEYKKIHFVRVDMEALPAIAQRCNVKALPTYQLYRNGEKLEEMSGAMPAKLVAMLKTHHIKEKKGGVTKLVAFLGIILLGGLGLLKIKDRIEEWEADEDIREEIAQIEAEARVAAQREVAEERRQAAREQARRDAARENKRAAAASSSK